ncbi:TPA: inovirus-type Gp2 protein [Yersinia enterocolitica]|uniref:YagK/YfjJ domain-containing protein n=1 Tax=Yersinia enterocolitica TaxID=630 RepID=UPI0029463EA7|nr:inovirus-type Gp2 protein [Yersinia enterocolitica]EKN6091655.1 inovirus Gp2 family protein [Yersinia enterocolitica]HED4494260.1 inovirus-type Gp2 protein [Yersinia enterocolitica]
MNDNYPYIAKYKMDWFLHSLINSHLNDIIERYSKVIGIRLDFSYNQNSDRYNKDYNCLQQDLRMLFEQVEKETGIAGFFWVIEYGKDSRFHSHSVVYLDGQKIRKAFPIAERIGALWKEITQGEGKYHRCEYKENYKADINKVINHRDTDYIHGLRYIISYLAKQEQKNGMNIFGSSEVPLPSGLGRPRKS